MRKKQLFALLMAGALSVGMAPTATFAADAAAETSAEGELEGELDSADTEEPSEDPAETPEEPAEDPAETPEDPAETPAETTADPTEAPAAEETDEQAAEAGSAIIVNGHSYSTLAEAFEAVPESADMTDETKYVKVKVILKSVLRLMFLLIKILCWLQQKMRLLNVRQDLSEACLL